MHISRLLYIYRSSSPLQYFLLTYSSPTHIYTLSLHDALPIYHHGMQRSRGQAACRRDPHHCQGSKSATDRKSTRLNSSHLGISYAVFCLKKKKNKKIICQNNNK